MMAQEKPVILVYNQVQRKPNPMVNINPLARGTGKRVDLADRLKTLKKSKVWQKQMQVWKNKGIKFDL